MDASTLKDQLAQIVRRRGEGAPLVEERLERLQQVSEALNDVVQTAQALPSDWANEPLVRDGIERLRDAEIAAGLDQARSSLTAVKARFERPTINIGVSGQARVGKSTFLQSVSGLGENQVPTGDNTNVTAVRSRIFHATEPRAYLEFHTESSFLDRVVRPYFHDLGLSPAPTSLEAFLRFDPDPSSLPSQDGRLSRDTEARWERLKEIHAALPSIRHLLGSGHLTLTDLSGLRPFVAYPTTEELRAERAGGPSVRRDYLAVADCRIESPFPETAVDRLGIVDLPGLGELASGIQQMIVNGLRDDVDVVLLMKRASVGLSNIGEVDIAALDLIDEARGAVQDSRDYCWIVINAGPEDATRVSALDVQIQEKVNLEGPESRHFVVVADATDAMSAHEQVLLPVLERLAQRLPEMDAQLLGGAVRDLAAPLQVIGAQVETLKGAMEQSRLQSGTVRQQLDLLARLLREDIQQDLKDVKTAKITDEYLVRYVERIEEVHEDVKEWLSEGLGAPHVDSKESWIEDASRRAGTEESYRPHAIAELNRLRVEITSRYSGLDEFLNDVLIEDFYGLMCDAIAGSGHFGSGDKSGADRSVLLGSRDRPASGRFDDLYDNLDACDPAVRGLRDAVDRLKGLRFDFRTQSYPVLDEINRSTRPTDGPSGLPPDFPSATVMYDWFRETATKYSADIRRELTKDAGRQLRTLSAAARLFEDEAIRSGTSVAEFRDLAEAYSNELWPGRFDETNSSSARAKTFGNAVARLKSAIDKATEE